MLKFIIYITFISLFASCAKEAKQIEPKQPERSSVVFSDEEYENKVSSFSNNELEKHYNEVKDSTEDIKVNMCSKGRYHYECINDHYNFYLGLQKLTILLVEKHNRSTDTTKKEKLRKQVTKIEEQTWEAVEELNTVQEDFYARRNFNSIKINLELDKICDDSTCNFNEDIKTISSLDNTLKLYHSASALRDEIYDLTMSGMLDEEIINTEHDSAYSAAVAIVSKISSYLTTQDFKLRDEIRELERNLRENLRRLNKFKYRSGRFLRIIGNGEVEIESDLSTFQEFYKNILAIDTLKLLNDEWLDDFKDYIKDESVSEININLDSKDFTSISLRHSYLQLNRVDEESFTNYFEYSVLSQSDSRLITPILSSNFTFNQFFSVFKRLDRESLTNIVAQMVPGATQLGAISIKEGSSDDMAIKLEEEYVSSYKTFKTTVILNKDNIAKLNGTLQIAQEFSYIIQSFENNSDYILNNLNIFEVLKDKNIQTVTNLIESFVRLSEQDKSFNDVNNDLKLNKKVISINSTNNSSKIETLILPEGLEMIQINFNPNDQIHFLKLWEEALTQIK
jgi:hypothetical protein